MGRPATCDCGECRKCKWRDYNRLYYQRPENTERLREIARKSRLTRLELVRAYDRERGFRGNKEQTWARNKARVLERQPCEVCGAEKAEAHHDDYTKPLEVRWLCKTHHAIHHRIY